VFVSDIAIFVLKRDVKLQLTNSLGQLETTPQTASLSVQLFFAGLTIATDRPTDRQTDHATPSVTIDRIYTVVRCGLIMSCAIL